MCGAFNVCKEAGLDIPGIPTSPLGLSTFLDEMLHEWAIRGRTVGPFQTFKMTVLMLSFSCPGITSPANYSDQRPPARDLHSVSPPAWQPGRIFLTWVVD